MTPAAHLGTPLVSVSWALLGSHRPSGNSYPEDDPMLQHYQLSRRRSFLLESFVILFVREIVFLMLSSYDETTARSIRSLL